MPQTRSNVLLGARAAALGLAVLLMWLAGGMSLRGPHLGILQGIAVLFLAGALLPRTLLVRPIVPILVLTGDVVALGVVGAWLHAGSVGAAAAPPSVAFLTGYLVTILVAVTGRRYGAAGLGGLAGTMILLLGESVTFEARVPEKPAPTQAVAESEARPLDPRGAPESRDLFLALRLLLLWASALECATIMGWMDEDAGRRRTAQAVDRELRSREVLASEMAALVAKTKSAESLRDLAEALLPHLRRHFPVEARAVFLEDATERVAIWEESGRLDEALGERRRTMLQEALREAGSSALVPRLEARSSRSSSPRSDRLATVAVPVHGTGRVAGVLVVADGRRQAMAPDRVAALAEVARQVGDAARRLERARDEQTRRTSLLLGQMREGVLLVGADGRVLLANPAASEMLLRLGQSPDGPIALGDMKPSEVVAIPAGAVRRSTLSVPSTTGRPYRVAVTAEGVVDGPARLGTLVTLADVTEEENARQRLLQAEKLSVVGQTLASVAHELNNPLAAILGYADLLAGAEVEPDVARILGRIREQAGRTSKIVKNLLSIARRRGPERAPVNLNEVVTGVADLFGYDARLSGISLVPDLDGALPSVEADRGALQQVLVNLVQNAIQALRSQGRGGRIDVVTSMAEGAVRLVVRDDGLGVPDPIRLRLFEPFVTTKGEEGTGLGLAISRGIAREHGGDLVLEDRDDGGRGAQFTLRLPLRTGRAKEVEPSPVDLPEGVSGRVLVVDDEPAVRDVVAATLRRLGAEVEAVATAEEALRRCEAGEAYDAVLVDLRLQGASGLDVHRRLRARQPLLARRLVFMTGDLVNDELIAEVRATGRPILEKPFTGEELRRALAAGVAV